MNKFKRKSTIYFDTEQGLLFSNENNNFNDSVDFIFGNFKNINAFIKSYNNVKKSRKECIENYIKIIHYDEARELIKKIELELDKLYNLTINIINNNKKKLKPYIKLNIDLIDSENYMIHVTNTLYDLLYLCYINLYIINRKQNTFKLQNSIFSELFKFHKSPCINDINKLIKEKKQITNDYNKDDIIDIADSIHPFLGHIDSCYFPNPYNYNDKDFNSYISDILFGFDMNYENLVHNKLNELNLNILEKLGVSIVKYEGNDKLVNYDKKSNILYIRQFNTNNHIQLYMEDMDITPFNEQIVRKSRCNYSILRKLVRTRQNFNKLVDLNIIMCDNASRNLIYNTFRLSKRNWDIPDSVHKEFDKLYKFTSNWFTREINKLFSSTQGIMLTFAAVLLFMSTVIANIYQILSYYKK